MSAAAFSGPLAENVRALRESQGLSQTQLSRRADVPRATLSNLESGEANPTISVLLRVASALGVRVEELLQQVPAEVRVFRERELPVRQRGSVRVTKLLPGSVNGLEVERIDLPPGTTLVGVPHTSGTREYLTAEKGNIELWVGGETLRLGPGDVAVFRGNQKHSYKNPGPRPARAFTVISFAGEIEPVR
jgi:XRE family transcriptional regulator, regulator of sulfur utilization